MAEDRSTPNPADEFSPSSAENAGRPGPEGYAGPSGPSGGSTPTSFYLEMAELWVQEHQKASMLGAFAVGVFVGALVRD
ncbi:MAG: hypothetical protein ABEL04_10585 [Salinibacter sp.]|uniref:hypothetical protein n=1 Tax=Salinibacter sp. TaxID=2065818 RepID=UPI0035D431B3